MRLIGFLLCGVMLAWPALAMPALLAFDRGDIVLTNPQADDITIRSAGVDRVRLQLWKLPDDKAENQIASARAVRSITENGLLARAMATKYPRWQADFVLPAAAQAATQVVPLLTATGPLPTGDYVVVARTTDGGAVAQWFSISGIAISAQVLGDGKIRTIVTNIVGGAPAPDAVVVALNDKGEVIGGARADSAGVAVWDIPAGAVLLRAESGDADQRQHRFLSLLPPDGIADAAQKNNIIIRPAFAANGVAAGATASFDLSVLGDDGAPMSAFLRYEFAQESYRFEWEAGADNNWDYRTIAAPTVLQTGGVRVQADQPAILALPVGEGRYRLAVSNGSDRAEYRLTAGWWRMLDNTAALSAAITPIVTTPSP
jgi:uncharacterized protein YfaS (alpha-2-macroglobulin family)